MHIGDRIKNRREALGLSQDELARRMGYTSRSTINKVEKGINDVTQTNVVKYAKALDTTVAYLMGWEESTVEETYNKKNAELLIEIAKNPVTMKLNHYFAQLSKPQQESVLNLVASMVPKDEVEIIPDNHLSK